ncbi:DNA polymerase III subunit alpha [Treponema brennaborense]|nr:DNA polymerase III subunit alpha [Treponema brennaborense]
MAVTDFVHLHVHSDYSLLDGAAKVKTLVARAKELGMSALALTDHGNMFGALRFEQLCHKEGIKPLVGCEFYVAGSSRHEHKGTEQGNKYYHLILIAKNVEGYRNLMMLTSRSYTEGMYYKPRIDEELIREYSGGLVCLSACLAGQLPQLLLNNQNKEAEDLVRRYRDIFGAENYFIELQDHGIAQQKEVAPKLIDIARKLGVPMVVTNDIHYCLKEDYIAQDVLVCIGTKKTRDDPRRMKFEGTEFYMKTGEEMAQLFPAYPEMIENTKRVADMCDLTIPQFSTKELKDCLPVYQIPPEFKTQDDYVRHLVYKGLEKRYPEITEEIRQRAEYELGIIFQMGFSGYFLIVWDFINWAKQNDIPVGPGRGSGAGSLVAYAMTITDIDPFRFNLIFERFLNPERISMPDFDVDICYEGRQDVIEYTRRKYGDPQVGHIVTFGTLKAKAVIKDVARVLDIPLSEVNILTKLVPDGPKVHLKDAFEVNEKIPGSGQLAPYRNDPRYKELFDLCFKLEDNNRNTSLHASGIVIGKSKLPEWAPVYKDSKTGKVAVQYTMDIIEPCGLVKMDYLGLKTLTLIKYAERIIRKRPGYEQFRADEVSETDEKTFDLFCAGQTSAVFQFESPGMQKILKQAQPRRLEDIVALNALYRPGPMDYIPQYIEGKFDSSKITYPDPCLKSILEETYGVMVYQEQVMQVAQRIAGYSLGGADMLRRAMGKKKVEVMAAEKTKFIEGAVKNGFTAEHAADIFEIMIPFAGYGFNKSHAAAYSVVAYRTAYLKANFPAEFIAANLTNEITSTDKLPEYITEGRSMGLEIDPPDINRSDKVFDVVDGRIVFGLLGIKGLGEAAADAIIAERKANGPYTDFMNFLDRVNTHDVNKKAIEVLIKTGAFDKLDKNRATLTANMERAIDYAESKKSAGRFGQVSLFEDSGVQEFADFKYEEQPEIPVMEMLNMEKELIGCYVSGHPLDKYRETIKNAATVTSATMGRAQEGKQYQIIGLLKNIRTITTKKGAQMAFAQLEDLNGSFDLTFFPKTWEQIKATGRVAEETVQAFAGKVDKSRDPDAPSFLVDELLDPAALQVKTARELHVKLSSFFTKEQQLYPLRDFLFGTTGTCCVYFHMETDNKDYIVKSNAQMTVPGTDSFISELESQPLVDSVWRE